MWLAADSVNVVSKGDSSVKIHYPISMGMSMNDSLRQYKDFSFHSV